MPSSDSDAIEELVMLWKEAGLTLKGSRPWMEFFEVFKPPVKTDLERRMSTNLLYYRANYCQVVCGLMVFAVVTSPRVLLGIILSMCACSIIYLVKASSVKVSDDFVIHLTKRNRAFAAIFSTIVSLVLTRALLWLLIFFGLALVFVLAHSALRPRTLAAKYNAASEDIRGIFSFQSSSTASKSDEEAAEDGHAYRHHATANNDLGGNLHSRRTSNKHL